jgi:hypothetical protein
MSYQSEEVRFFEEGASESEESQSSSGGNNPNGRRGTRKCSYCRKRKKIVIAH